MIQVSIPGKIHLIGEHSAVYGKPAILASINLYLHARISKSKVKRISGIVQYDNAIKNLQETLEKTILKKFSPNLPNPPNIPNYKLEISSEIPLGSGLGTSASLSATFTICLLKFLKIKHTTDDVFEIALEGEKIFHGNPSGGDLAAVLQKGIILFKKDPDQKVNITPLKFKVPDNLKNLVLIDSGKPAETTAEMVFAVSLRSASRQSRNLDFKKILDHQEDLAKQMLQVLKNGDQKEFTEIIKKAEGNLEKLGVVGKTAKIIIRKIEGLGGAAKITGAGGVKKGSGIVLAYHDNPGKLVEFAKSNKLSYYQVQI